GQSAINDRVRPVLAGQASSPWGVRQGLEYIEKRVGAPRDVISAIAGAPYFEMRQADTNPSLTVDQVLAALNDGITDQETGNYSKAIREQGGLAVRYGLQWTAYEGGPDTSGGNNIAAKRDATRDVRMQDLVQRYLRVWGAAGGGQFNWFVTGAGPWD